MNNKFKGPEDQNGTSWHTGISKIDAKYVRENGHGTDVGLLPVLAKIWHNESQTIFDL